MIKKSNRMSLKNQYNQLIADRITLGRSKYQDKIADKEYIADCQKENIPIDRTKLMTKRNFYTASTAQEYVKTAVDYTKYARNCAGSTIQIDDPELLKYVPQYLDSKKEAGCTPKTLEKFRCQLSKIYEKDFSKLYHIDDTNYNSIKGRGTDDHWKFENHADDVKFWTACGVRKAEYRFMNQHDWNVLQKNDPQVYDIFLRKKSKLDNSCSNIQLLRTKKDNYYVVTACGKHGRTNRSLVRSQDVDYLKKEFSNPAKLEKHFREANKDHANVHACRRQYAQNLYKEYARPIEDLDQSDIYYTRDGTYRSFDRRALSCVARSLGHSQDRLYDVVHSYMR